MLNGLRGLRHGIHSQLIRSQSVGTRNTHDEEAAANIPASVAAHTE